MANTRSASSYGKDNGLQDAKLDLRYLPREKIPEQNSQKSGIPFPASTANVGSKTELGKGNLMVEIWGSKRAFHKSNLRSSGSTLRSLQRR